MTPVVAIVVLNWNGKDDTLACLASLQALTYSARRVIVVDNGSSDGSAAAIRFAFPTVELIETGRNLGFAGGNNVGIRRALETGADHVLLLNNDTEVHPGLLEAFIEAAKRHPWAGAFGANIYFHAEKRRIWWAGAAWNEQAAHFDQLREGQLDDGEPDAPFETAYACGCALFMPAGPLREVGLLDETYFLYFEETDWCFRARAAGYPSIVVPGARVWHKVSVSMGGEDSPLPLYFLTRNRLLWVRKHGTPKQQRAVRQATWQGLGQRFVAHALLPASGASLKARWWALREAVTDPHNLAFLMGVRDYVLGRFGDCPPVVRKLAARARERSQRFPKASLAHPAQR